MKPIMNFKKADWDAWLENPVTRDFFTAIEEKMVQSREEWNYLSWSSEEMWEDREKAYAFRTASKGRYEMGRDILEINLYKMGLEIINLLEEEDKDREVADQRDNPD